MRPAQQERLARSLAAVIREPGYRTSARRLAAGDGLAAAASPLGQELLVGAGYAAAAAVLLKIFEWESRRTASLDVL